jgi:hypothetical protein
MRSVILATLAALTLAACGPDIAPAPPCDQVYTIENCSWYDAGAVDAGTP